MILFLFLSKQENNNNNNNNNAIRRIFCLVLANELDNLTRNPLEMADYVRDELLSGGISREKFHP